MNLSRIKALVIKEFFQIRRDKRTLGIILFVPAFLLVMYGYAINLDIKNMSLGIYDLDKTPTSQRLIEALFEGGYSSHFTLKHWITHPHEIDTLLLTEQAEAVLVIPPSFQQRLLRQEPASVQLIIDGVNASRAATAIGFLENALIQFGTQFSLRQQPQLKQIFLPIDYRTRIWYNPELKSNQFLIPGLIALILMVITVVVTSTSIVREQERGSMEQLIVSPLHAGELIVGKLIPYALISLLATALILLASAVLFDISVKGSYLWLFITVIIFLFGALGTGLLISTLVRTQEVAFMLATTSTLMPTFVLSGFVFPISNMPMPVQLLTYFIPARYFLVALRHLMLKGSPWIAFWPDLALLSLYALFTLTLGTIRLKKLID